MEPILGYKLDTTVGSYAAIVDTTFSWAYDGTSLSEGSIILASVVSLVYANVQRNLPEGIVQAADSAYRSYCYYSQCHQYKPAADE